MSGQTSGRPVGAAGLRVLLSLLVTGMVVAQDPADPTVTPEPSVASEGWGPYLLDHDGFRRRLEDKGFTFGGGIVLDLSSPFGIDARRRGTTRTLFDVNLLVSSEAVTGHSGGSFYIDTFALVGRDGNRDLGSLLGVSALDAEETFQIGELWVEQYFCDRRLRAKFGKIDALSEFGVSELSGLFPGPSASWSPTMVGQPTYPDSATGALCFWYPDDHWYFGAGLFDGATQDGVPTGTRGPSTFFRNHKADSYYLTGEAGFRFHSLPEWGEARLAIGGFHHTGRFDRFDGGTERGVRGGWLLAEQEMMREEDPGQGLDLSLRLGWTDRDIAPVHQHLAVAFSYRGLIAGRDEDVVGLQWNMGRTSRVPGSPFRRDEHQVELFYRYQVTPFLHVQPAVQYFKHPGGGVEHSDELVALVRLELTF